LLGFVPSAFAQLIVSDERCNLYKIPPFHWSLKKILAKTVDYRESLNSVRFLQGNESSKRRIFNLAPVLSVLLPTRAAYGESVGGAADRTAPAS